MAEQKQQQNKPVPYEVYWKQIEETNRLQNRNEALEHEVKELKEIIDNNCKVEFNTASHLAEAHETKPAQGSQMYKILEADEVKIWRLLGKAHKRTYIHVPSFEERSVINLSDFEQEL